MKLVAVNKRDQNIAWIDPWSAVHFSAGLAFGLVNIPFTYTLSAAIVWDIFEHFFERSRFGQSFFKTSGPESLGNVGTDTVLFLAAWKLGQMYNATGPAVNHERRPIKRKRGTTMGRSAAIRRAAKNPHEPRGMRERKGAEAVSRRDAIAGSIDFGLR